MSYADDVSGPVGVGGWMYLFLAGFALLTPLNLLIGTYNNLYAVEAVAQVFGDGWLTYQIIEWLLVTFSLGLIAYVTWRLFNVQNHATVRLTIIAIPVLSLGILFVDMLAASFLAGVSLGFVMQEMLIDLVRSLVYCAIWCSYFMVSQRVKNTYLAVHDDELGEVFQ